MRFDAFIKALCADKTEYETNVPMSRHTTFKIGGNADAVIRPHSSDELVSVLKKAREYEVPCFIMGNGSNILVSDDGIEGAVIDMQGISGISVSNGEIVCGAGDSLRSVCIAARDAGLTGLEFAYGIPGTAGGALFMNAGAYGGEMKDVAVSAVCIDKNLSVCELKANEMDLGYRKSAFQKSGMIIVSVKLSLKLGKKEEISAKMDEIFKRRAEKQPLEYPSAGSTFKRPEGNYAGTLIESSGLKGESFGGAEVSRKHAGFIVNRSNATAKDVLSLIKKVQATVKDKSGIELEPEVLFVGRR